MKIDGVRIRNESESVARKFESSNSLRSKVRLRTPEQLAEAWDSAYRLTWGLAHLHIHNLPYPEAVRGIGIRERRRAIEYALSEFDWDDISLNT